MNWKVSAREKKLLAVLVSCVLLLIFYNFVYQPQSTALAEAKGKLKQKKGELDRVGKMLLEKKSWEKQKLKQEPSSLTGLLGQVNALASGTKVKIIAFRPETLVNPDGKKQMVLHIAVEGSFISLENFFSSWEQVVKDGIMTSVEIAPKEKQQGELQGNLTVKALFL